MSRLADKNAYQASAPVFSMITLVIIMTFTTLQSSASGGRIEPSIDGDDGNVIMCTEESVCILVARFGEAKVGLSVATILNLQILGTLRQSYEAEGEIFGPFGDGKAVWTSATLTSHQQAEDQARKCLGRDCDIVFWGGVYRIGDEAVVLSYLTIPDSARSDSMILETDDRQVWKVAVAGTDFHSDLPVRKLSFDPFLINKQSLGTYSSPDDLVLDNGEAVGASFRIERWIVPGKAVVKASSGRHGVLNVPNLGERSHAASFAAGVIRAFRGDWGGVVDMMEPIASDPKAPIQLRQIAYWYYSWALIESEQPAVATIKAALQTMPGSHILGEAWMMAALAEYERSGRRDAQGVINAVNAMCSRGADNRWLEENFDSFVDNLEENLEDETEVSALGISCPDYGIPEL